MSSVLSESLLEMHYFRVLLEHFKEILGTKIEVFKPTSNIENWYGFDQAYFTSQPPQSQFIGSLRKHIHTNEPLKYKSFRLFALQFKVVHCLARKSKVMPRGWSTPYYRSDLYLFPNKSTGISQHETLKKIAALDEASVSYVCPMVFDNEDIIREPKFSDLQFVDVRTSPNGWLTNEPHFIAFQNVAGSPHWCSDPIKAVSLTWSEVIGRSVPLEKRLFLDSLQKISVFMSNKNSTAEWNSKLDQKTKMVEPSVSIVVVAELA